MSNNSAYHKSCRAPLQLISRHVLSVSACNSASVLIFLTTHRLAARNEPPQTSSQLSAKSCYTRCACSCIDSRHVPTHPAP
eukprot:27917_5